MKFEKGKPRPANAGRKKGTPNKKKVLKVADLLAEKDINPTQKILDLMPFLEPDEQARTWLNLLSYCQAKPTENIDDSDGDGTEDLLKQFENVSDATLISIAGGKKEAS